MKVHITLQEKIRSDARAKQAALEQIQSVANLSSLNLRRFERHGIISADIEPSDVTRVESLDAVKSVSADQVQRALSK
jgi:hypothetical protein